MQSPPVLTTTQVLPRLVQACLQASSADTPAGLLQGPRSKPLARCERTISGDGFTCWVVLYDTGANGDMDTLEQWLASF
jgi:hypothetical protein